MNGPDRYTAASERARRLVADDDRLGLLDMLDSEDQAERESAVWGLGRLVDPRDLPRLAQLLGDPFVDDAAEESLKDFGAQAQGVLLSALDRPDGKGRLHALDALRTVGGAAAVERLARFLQDPDAIVRDWTIQALADIGERGAPAAWDALFAHHGRETDPDLAALLASVLRGR